jgi:hypothetical protein
MLPPRAPVVSYQYVDRPSAAANGMSSGCAETPLAWSFLRSLVYSFSVVGMVVTPALANMCLFTVVTMNDAS